MSSYIDLNDPEVIDSLKYLQVPKEMKIKMQSQPFDGKKNCWIPDHKEGYLAAEIQSKKGDDVTVKTSKGEVNTHTHTLIYYTLLVVYCCGFLNLFHGDDDDDG